MLNKLTKLTKSTRFPWLLSMAWMAIGSTPTVIFNLTPNKILTGRLLYLVIEPHVSLVLVISAMTKYQKALMHYAKMYFYQLKAAANWEQSELSSSGTQRLGLLDTRERLSLSSVGRPCQIFTTDTAAKHQGLKSWVCISQPKRVPSDFWNFIPIADLKVKLTRQVSTQKQMTSKMWKPFLKSWTKSFRFFVFFMKHLSFSLFSLCFFSVYTWKSNVIIKISQLIVFIGNLIEYWLCYVKTKSYMIQILQFTMQQIACDIPSVTICSNYTCNSFYKVRLLNLDVEIPCLNLTVGKTCREIFS